MNNQIVPFEEVVQIGKAMAESKYFDATNAAQAIVKVMAGRELGLGAFASMSGIHIIQGKPALGANLLASLIKNDPRYDYRVAELTGKRCEIIFYENAAEVGRSEFTADDAKRVGTKNMDKFPKNMLFARAISNGAKWYTPGIFGGAPVYTPEELGADTDEDGNIIDVTPTSATVTFTKPANSDEVLEVIDYEPEPTVHTNAKRSWDGAVITAITRAGLSKDGRTAVLALNKSSLADTKDVDAAVEWMTTYRTYRNTGMDSDLAASMVNGDETAEGQAELGI